MARKKTNEEFVEEVKQLVGDEYIFLEEYKGVHKKIKCKHNQCGYKWYVSPGNFFNGTICPVCSEKNKKEKANIEFKKKIYNLVENEYTFLENYTTAHSKILCRHNICGHEWKISPANFLYQDKRCPACYINSITKSNEQFKAEVYNLVGDEYIFLEEYVNNATKIKCRHNKCGFEWNVIPTQFIYSMSRCPKCAGVLKKTTKQFKQEVYDLEGDEYEVLGEYINAKTKILMKHLPCNYKYYVTPNAFLRNRRCPNCIGERISEANVKTHLQFIQEVLALVGDEYEVIGKYKNSYTKIKIKHNLCKEVYEVKPNSFLNGQRCPRCNSSKGELFIAKILDKMKVEYELQYVYDNCRDKKPLPFDFYLPDYNLLIEYDGKQHFEPVDFAGKGKKWANKQFEYIQQNDKIKTQYCKNNNIKLLRIPYWKFDSIKEILENELKVGEKDCQKVS